MIYCDTSLLVAALTSESETMRTLDWLESHHDSALCTSGWTLTEFSGAIALKSRRGDLSPEERAEIQTTWRTMLDSSLALLPFPEAAFDLAGRFCEMRASSLRADDALHLAVASLGGHSLATLDKAMAEAALAVGVTVQPI